MGFRALTAGAVLLCWALTLHAQQSIKLQFDGGLVTLSAQNAPVRVILAEWARLGGATIVNGDHVAGAPVTLELTRVPERQALDIVLRGVAGYMLAPRQAGLHSTSTFDRIVILPTSAAPKNPPPPAVAAGSPRPVLRRPSLTIRPSEATVEAPVEAGQNDPDPVGAPEPVASSQPGAGGTGGPRQPVGVRARQPPGAQPSDPDDEPDDQEEPDPARPAAGAPTPGNPFGIPPGSSATPGVVTTVPPPRPQPQGSQSDRVQ